jgi:hypothetical protein
MVLRGEYDKATKELTIFLTFSLLPFSVGGRGYTPYYVKKNIALDIHTVEC